MKKRKLLRPQDRLLLVLAGVGDILSFLHEEIGIGKMSLRSLYGWTPVKYKQNSFRSLVYRMLKTGYIEKIIKDDEVYFRLTSRGEKVIVRDFPLVTLQKRKWDEKWRVVMFDIEEINKKDREFLRKKLRELGFCMFQKSVYISPLDITAEIEEFLEENGLRKQATIMETRIRREDAKILASNLWKLERLNDKYRKVLDELEERQRMMKEGIFTEQKTRTVLKKIKSRYLEVLKKDPFLPEALLPNDWKGRDVKKLILNLERNK